MTMTMGKKQSLYTVERIFSTSCIVTYYFWLAGSHRTTAAHKPSNIKTPEHKTRQINKQIRIWRCHCFIAQLSLNQIKYSFWLCGSHWMRVQCSTEQCSISSAMQCNNFIRRHVVLCHTHKYGFQHYEIQHMHVSTCVTVRGIVSKSVRLTK
jgi:hypothetical protein